jgi:hypothetical protein
MPIGIALAMVRKLTARWYYQYSKPCRDTRKPMHCGKGHQQDFSTTSMSCTPHTSEVSIKVRSTGRSSFWADKSTTSLSPVPIILWRKEGILDSFNGTDIDQRREYVKVSWQSHVPCMLKAHGCDNPSRPRSKIPSPSSRLLRLPLKSSLLQSDQLRKNRSQLQGAQRTYVRVHGLM